MQTNVRMRPGRTSGRLRGRAACRRWPPWTRFDGAYPQYIYKTHIHVRLRILVLIVDTCLKYLYYDYNN